MPNQEVRILYHENGATIYSNQSRSTPGVKLVLNLKENTMYQLSVTGSAECSKSAFLWVQDSNNNRLTDSVQYLDNKINSKSYRIAS